MMNHCNLRIDICLKNSFLTNRGVIHGYRKMKAYQTEYHNCIEGFGKIQKYTQFSSIAEVILSTKSSNAREVEWFFLKPYE